MSRAGHWRTRISYAWAIGRRTGPWRLLLMILRGLLEPLISWRTYDFYARDLTAAPLAPFHAEIPVDIRMATDEDFSRFRAALLREGVSWGEIEARRKAGDRCFIGVVDGQLIQFTWLFRRSAQLSEIGATLRLDRTMPTARSRTPSPPGEAAPCTRR